MTLCLVSRLDTVKPVPDFRAPGTEEAFRSDRSAVLGVHYGRAVQVIKKEKKRIKKGSVKCKIGIVPSLPLLVIG